MSVCEIRTIVAVAGSRDYPVLEDVDDFIDELAVTTMVLSGYARGVDRRATRRARNRGLKAEDLPADWERLPKTMAGYIRNSELVRRCDKLVAFWDEASNGTLDSIVKAIDHGEKLYAVVLRASATWTVHGEGELPHEAERGQEGGLGH